MMDLEKKGVDENGIVKVATFDMQEGHAEVRENLWQHLVILNCWLISAAAESLRLLLHVGACSIADGDMGSPM